MRIFVRFVVLLGACAVPIAWPIAASAADPRAVLAAARAASGGPAWDGIASLRVRYATPSGPVDELQDVETGRFVRRGVSEVDGFDGVSVWTQGHSGVAYVLGDDDAQLGAANDGYRAERAWWFPDRHPAAIEDAGVVHDGGASYDTVRISPAGGRPFTLWIDRRTHLIARDVERVAESNETMRFSDYRRVAGVMLPFRIEIDDETRTVQDVAVNVPFEPTAFSIPPVPPLDLASGPVTVPFRLDDGKIVISVTLDGQGPFDCMFDSGGSLIVTPALVKRLGLDARRGANVTGGGEGSVASSIGALDSLAIGGAPLGRQVFDSFELFSEAPERMLAGLEVLQRYVVRFDFDSMTMTLTPPEQFHYAGSGTIIPFHFQSNQPEVFGSVDGIAGKFTIDTGDDSSLLLTAPFAKRYGLIEKYHAHIPYGGSSVGATHGVWAQRAGSVVFDGFDGRAAESVSRPVTRISTQEFGFDANRYVSANIGIGIIKQFNVTFDYSRRQLILERNHFYGQPDVFNRAGMELQRDTDRWTVRRVYDDSPAAIAGIRKGDVVTRIDGKTPAQLDDNAWSLLKTGPPGSIVRVEFVRDNTSQRVELHLDNDVL